jgi:hypothetical protein
MAKKEVKVRQAQGKKELPLDLVAQEVVKIGESFKTLQSSLINRKTLVDLIYANVKGKKISRENIEEIIRVASNLPEFCLKPASELKTMLRPKLDSLPVLEGDEVAYESVVHGR